MKKLFKKLFMISSIMLLSLTSCHNKTSSDNYISTNSNNSINSNYSSNTSEDDKNIMDQDKKINLYLIMGQSNAVGYGMDNDCEVSNEDTRFVDGFDNVLYYGNQERWSTPLKNKFVEVELGLGVDVNRSGAEIGIASALKDNEEMNAVVKCAWGATHLYPDTINSISYSHGTWTSPSYITNKNIDLSSNEMIGNMYNRFYQTVVNGLTLLKDSGYQPIINGIWWMQGEAEMFSLTMANEYKSLLTNLINDVRYDLSEITGFDCNKTPFVIGLPKWNIEKGQGPGYQNSVRSSMISVSKTLENVSYIDCADLKQHDEWHFDAKSQKYLGEKFIEKVNELNDAIRCDENIYINNNFELLLDDEGLGFNANIISYDVDNEYEYGMIHVLTSKLLNNEINEDYISLLNEKSINYTLNKCDIVEEKIDRNYRIVSINSKLKKIPYDHLNDSYSTIAFIKNGDKYYYSNKLDVNLAYSCSKELYNSKYDQSKLMKIINAAINNKLGVDESNKYQNPEFKLEVNENMDIEFSQVNESKLGVIQNPNMGFFVNYQNSNDNVLTINDNGIINTKNNGTSTLSISCAGINKEINVNVNYLSSNGVTYDAKIEKSEYFSQNLNKSNEVINLQINGKIVNNDIHLAFEFVHDNWSNYDSINWWLNDNIEFKLDNGKSHTVIFYEGVPTFSNEIKEGVALTKVVDGKLVTTVELILEGTNKDSYTLQVGMNGANIGWFGAIWDDQYYDYNVYITKDGITEISNIDDLCLDGLLNESIYNDDVLSNTLTYDANGANVELGGTLLEKGALIFVKINHKTAPSTSFANGEWYSYMNIEFRFNNDIQTQYITTCNNHTSKGKLYSYCQTNKVNDGYVSTFEIYVPYSVIGVENSISRLDFTCNGNFESGWCWMNGNTEWVSTHFINQDGVFAK